MRPIATMLLALACSAVAGCSDPPQASSTSASSPAATSSRPVIKLRFADLINVDVRDVPLLMAFDELSAHGYVIEKTYLTSGALLADLVARGDADVAVINNQTTWAAIAKGARIRTVAQFTATTSLLAAREDIRACRDLNGRRVGTAGATGLSPLLFTSYLARRCPGTEPQVMVIPESGARAAALVGGRIDAVLLPGEELLKLQRHSAVPFHTLMTYAEEFPEVQIDGVHVRREWAEQNPEAVKDLLRAKLRAERLIMANPQVLYDESVRRLSLDAETAAAIGASHLQMGIWAVNGGMTSRSIQSTIDFLVNANALPPGLTPERVADLSYLDAVLAEIGRAQDAPSQEGSRPSR